MRITREVALALDHAHRRGVVHRDIERAFDCLFRAVDCGFAHREWMENDADLGHAMRTDPR